ncbi:MAG: NADH:ubiquinone reductase (Na(+)-transporting) subunit B [Acidobacteriota bacterium]|nr:NADH:ubiquinone reductase (Na(+)-transporting) subunit B [Acidobacteriota bacterium]
MKFLHDLFQKNEHMFLKGGKLEKFYPLYEAQESFLFTPKNVTNTRVHVRDSLDSKRLMSMVIVALVPCILYGAYNVGLQMAKAAGDPTDNIAGLFGSGFLQILPIIIVSYAAGGVWEVLFAVLRRHEINEGFLVTGILFPLTCPPDIPLWQVAVGISFGVVIGKEIFGGTGMNVLNPALTARAFLYFSYPQQISGDLVWVAVDGYSAATPLSAAAATATGASTTEALAGAGYSMSNMFWGAIPGSIGETSAFACLIGAVILIACGVGSWRIMASTLGGAAVTAALLQAFAGPDALGMLSMTPWEHLVAGGLMFGAVFMATDPVSAARTTTGQWVYGFLIGFITILIRTWNPAYPEGVMLAILFMNIFAPLIDHQVVQANVKRRLSRAT